MNGIVGGEAEVSRKKNLTTGTAKRSARCPNAGTAAASRPTLAVITSGRLAAAKMTAAIGYSVRMVVQAAIAFVFLILDQYLLAGYNAAGVLITVFCLVFLITGRPAIGFIAVNAQNIAGVVLTTVYTGLETGFSSLH